MNENLFLRFLLNSKKRVDTVAKYSLDTEVVDVIGLFATLSKIFPVNVYPLPRTLLELELPQYKELWESIPDELNGQEEEYCLQQYQTKVGRAVALAKFSQRKTNPEYVKEIWEELSGLYNDDLLTEIEEEFSLKDLHLYLDEDRKLVTNIIPTPFPGLNSMLGGGFLPQRMYAFESTIKSFKSMLFLFLGVWLAKQGYKIEYISTELLPLEMRERVTKMAQGLKDPLTIRKYQEITSDEVTNITECYTGNFSYKFLSNPSMLEVSSYLKKREYDLVIIDHPSHGFMRPKQAMSSNEEWRAVKAIYKDIFRFSRENKKPVIVPSWVNKAGHESLENKHDSSSHHTGGSFDTNAILDAKFAIIRRPDYDKGEEEKIVQLKPLFLRRPGPNAGPEKLLQLAFTESNCLFREVPTITEEQNKKKYAVRSKGDREDYSRRGQKSSKDYRPRKRGVDE